MPIGLSNGKLFEDQFQLRAAPFVEIEPGEVMPLADKDNNVKTPGESAMDQRLKKMNLDPKIGWGEEVSFKTPLESPEKPAGEFNPSPGSRVAGSNFDALRAPYGVMSEGEIPEGSLQGQVYSNKISSIVDAFKKLIGRNVDLNTEEGIGAVNDVASSLVFAPAPIAGKVADGTLGSFAGVKSKTMPLRTEDLELAKTMEAAGEHPENIYRETGFFKGQEDKWRYEIPSEGMKLKPEVFNVTDNQVSKYNPETREIEKINVPKYQLDAKYGIGSAQKPLLLKDVIDHPELFENYPHLENIKMGRVPIFSNSSGSYGKMRGTGEPAMLLGNLTEDEMKKTILHETQHAIQEHEGFTYGGSPEDFLSNRWKDLNQTFEQRKQNLRDWAIGQGKYKDLAEKGEYTPPFKTHSDFLDAQIALERYNEVEAKGGPDKLGKYSRQTYDEKTLPLVEDLKKRGFFDDMSKIVQGRRIQQDVDSLAYEHYNRIAGEVEARNVEKRMGMPWQERLAKSPLSTADTPVSEQITSPVKRGASSVEEPERVKSAAIKYKGDTYEGLVHAFAMNEIEDKFGPNIPHKDLEEGFTTNKGRFISREEAFKLAKDKDQVRQPVLNAYPEGKAPSGHYPSLLSEDLKDVYDKIVSGDVEK